MKKSMISRVHRFLSSDSEGGALVEMAVTLPLIMLIMTGIFSFSMALYQKLQLAEAVSSAGRYIATARGDNDPCANTVTALYSASPGLAHDSTHMIITLTDNGAALASSCPLSAGSALTKGDLVAVKVNYPITLNVANIWGSGSGFGNVTLVSQITEVVQ